MSKFSEFKPIVSELTPLSMMQYHPDSSAYPGAYRNEAKGVVPGYAGHVPKARDTFGSSAVGGLAPEPHVGAHKKLGAMTGHAQPVPWEKNYDWETQVYNSFSEKKTGVMPGYAGFRPGARDVDGIAAYGGIPHDGSSGQGDNGTQKRDWDQGRMKPATDYRKVVSGIVPGYTGHVPNAIDKHGTTYFGAIEKAGDQRTTTLDQLYVDDGADSGDGGTHYGAQRGHTNSLLDKCNDVTCKCSNSERTRVHDLMRVLDGSTSLATGLYDEKVGILRPHARRARCLRHDCVQPQVVGR